MSSKSYEVPVEAGVMKWARESAGRTIGDVAKRLAVDEELVNGWECGRKKPTISQLRSLAKYYQRPTDAFLLMVPPQEPPLPHDFRTLPNKERTSLHAETFFALRKARRLQEIASELKGDFKGILLDKIDNLSDAELVAAKAREYLGIDPQIQSQWKDNSAALKQWIKLIESKMDIIVIQIPMPIEDARAFALRGKGYPIIVLNTNDSKNARIFSLFHELGHVLLDEDSICNLEGDLGSEGFCNNFAGAFLVPKDELLKSQIVVSRNSNENWSDKSLKSLSRSFKVSEEVVLRRLLKFGLTTKEYYKSKRQEWAILEEQRRIEKETRQKETQEKQTIRRNVARECIQRNGESIVSLILESYYADKLTKYDISSYLEVNLKHLPKIEKTLWA